MRFSLVIPRVWAATAPRSTTTGGGGTAAAPGSATSGSITWSVSPIAGAGVTDVRNVLISAFEKQYPKIHVTLVSAPADTDTDRATMATEISSGSSSPDVFPGGRGLARSVRRRPAGRTDVGLPAGQLLV
jgi:multiple sugar transport system substrate-binding protein